MSADLSAQIQSVLSDPESMEQIRQLAEMLGTGDAAQDTASAAPSADSSQMPEPAALLQLGQMLQKAPTDKNAALLLALRPHLGAARQGRVDRAVRLLRLWAAFKTMRDSGMLQKLL